MGRRHVWIGIALALLTAAVFARALTCDFIRLDDDQYVTQNLHVQQGLSWQSISWAFTASTLYLWHPLTMLSLMLDHDLFGLQAWGFHATNVLLHIANVVLLYGLFARMTGSVWRSALVAALWAVHPLRVESVVWVVERKDVLSTLLALASLWVYVSYTRKGRWWRYALMAFWLATSLLAKPMYATLPAVMLLLDWWPLGRIADAGARGDPAKGRRMAALVWEKVPLVLVVAAVTGLVFTMSAMSAQTRVIHPAPRSILWANAVISYVRYMGKMVRLDALAMFYPMPADGWATWATVAAGLLLAAVSVWALSRWKKAPWLAVGWLWYVGTLLPVSGIAGQVGNCSIADRYTYFSMIGLLVMVAWAVPRRWVEAVNGRRVVAAAAGVVIIVLSVFTVRQIGYWKDTYTLASHALQVTEGNWLAHDQLGHFYLDQGQVDQAMSHYKQALGAQPGDVYAHTGIAMILRQAGKPLEAMAHFAAATEADPTNAVVRGNLASCLAEQGQLDQAIREYSEAVRLNPKMANVRGYLANALASQGRLDEAMAQYEESLRLAPGAADVRSNMAIVLAARGQTARAIAEFETALAAAGNSGQTQLAADIRGRLEACRRGGR